MACSALPLIVKFEDVIPQNTLKRASPLVQNLPLSSMETYSILSAMTDLASTGKLAPCCTNHCNCTTKFSGLDH